MGVLAAEVIAELAGVIGICCILDQQLFEQLSSANYLT